MIVSVTLGGNLKSWSMCTSFKSLWTPRERHRDIGCWYKYHILPRMACVQCRVMRAIVSTDVSLMADYGLMTLVAMTAYLTLLAREKTNIGSNCRISFFTLESCRDLAVIGKKHAQSGRMRFERKLRSMEKEVVENRGLLNHMRELCRGKT